MDYCIVLAEKVGNRVCLELLDPKKALHYYLSAVDGKFSAKNITEDVRKASIGMRANNDPSEGNFGCFSEAFQYCRGMGLGEAAHLGQSRYNKDNNRLASALATGKRSKAERDGDDIVEQEVGLFHQLPSALTDSLIVSAKRQADRSRRTFNEALRVQAVTREENQKVL